MESHDWLVNLSLNFRPMARLYMTVFSLTCVFFLSVSFCDELCNYTQLISEQNSYFLCHKHKNFPQQKNITVKNIKIDNIFTNTKQQE